MTRRVMMSGKQVRLSMAVLAAAVVLTAGGTARTQQGPTPYVISQRGRAFNPNFLSIKQGDTVRIVNDDGDLLHHAYVESDTFNFDSGDQLPGSKTDVVFSVRGKFNVLCGIHPKMKLIVVVK
ncbi:MAG TPA: methylamine utilization protein [Methylovirgula sp.]